jgi:hypothetical protein
MVISDERLVDDSGYRLSGHPIEDTDEDGDDSEAGLLEAVAVVGVGLRRGLAPDVVVGAVCNEESR